MAANIVVDMVEMVVVDILEKQWKKKSSKSFMKRFAFKKILFGLLYHYILFHLFCHNVYRECTMHIVTEDTVVVMVVDTQHQHPLLKL